MLSVGRIACVYVPNLPLLIEHERRGHTEPLIVVHPVTEGHVFAASDVLLSEGVQPGMSVYQAQQIAPQAILIRADEEAYFNHHARIVAALHHYTEKVETIALGEWCLDWQGIPDEQAFTAELRSAVRAASGLPVRVGVANGKYAAQQAARASDFLLIPPGEGARFLAPLPITALPNLPGEFRRRLELLDLNRLGDLATISREAMLSQFGEAMSFWHDLARGRDPRPLQPDAPPLREALAKTLPEATARREALEYVARRLAAKISRRLQQRGYQAEALKLALEDEAGQLIERGQAIKPPTSDDERLTRVALLMVAQMIITVSIRRVEVAVYPLRPFQLGARQSELLERDQREVKHHRVQTVLQTLRRRFGEGVVLLAALVGLPVPLPIKVSLNGDGQPSRYTWRGQKYDVLAIEDGWRLNSKWWLPAPLNRDYFEVLLISGPRVIFQNLDNGEWFLDKGWGRL
jgi:DNA polymerase-4